MKQALLMNPDSMKDLLNSSSPISNLGGSHSSFTSRRDWQSVTVSFPCGIVEFRVLNMFFLSGCQV